MVTVVKYSSAVLILIAMAMHTMGGFTPYNAYVQLLGVTGWCYVGYKWKEKAILLNFLPQYFIIIPVLVYMFFAR